MMADKITVAEAVNLANQDTAKLSNEQLVQMNEAFAESFFNRETLSDDAKIASDVTIAEIDARLEALHQNQNSYDEKDLDSIIAMAESVGMFSQKADIAKTVLEKAQKQKADMAAAAQNNAENSANDKENKVEDTVKQDTKENTAQENTAQENTAKEDTAKEDTVTVDEGQEELSAEDEAAIEVVENTPEDQAELDKFDKENGLDSVSQEQLEKNDKIMDNILPPLSVDKSGKLINPEFQDELKAIRNLTITDDNGKELSAEKQATAKGDLIVAAQLEAEIAARAQGNGNEADVQKFYYEQFKEALQRNVVAAAFASDVKKGMSKEQLQEKFAQAVNNPQKATIGAVRAVSGQSYAKSDKIVDRLKKKFKSLPAVQKMDNKVKAFDQRMTERYGKKWQITKRFSKVAWKSIKNVAIYSAIGAVAGPAAPAAFLGLAAKSAYDSTKALQAEAEKNNMSLWQYTKANKAKVVLAFATTGLALAGSAIGVGNSLGVVGNDSQFVKETLKWSARGLAVAKNGVPTLWHAAKAGYKKYVKKDNEAAQAEWAKAKENWNRTLEAAIGIGIGTAAAEFISEAKANTVDTGSAESAPATPQMQEGANSLAPDWEKVMTHDWQNNAGVENPLDQNQESFVDRDHDGVPDAIDRDGGQGWTTANETQLDRLMDADPAKVNALLNDGEWHSSAELKEMMANGQLSDEQVKGIHELATKEFDENGHIIDSDLKDYYEEQAREAAAKEASAQNNNHSQENGAKEENGDKELNNLDNQEIQNDGTENVSPEMTPQRQRAYQEILNIISQGEDMNNPEVRASVENLAKIHLQEIQEALDRGDNVSVAQRLVELHNQGEYQEVREATQANEDDRRKMRHAKEDVWEAKEKLDAAKAAYDQDPNNEKLKEEVEKLTQKFEKESLDLEQRGLKETISELDDQIKQDQKEYNGMDKTYKNIEKNFGLSEEQVNQKLATMGIDVNNLPQETSDLPLEAQNLITIHGIYEQAHQNEAELQNRIQENTQHRDDLKEQYEQSKADEKALKKDKELNLEAQERIAGDSRIENSDLSKRTLDLMDRQEQQTQTAQPNEVKGEIKNLRGLSSVEPQKPVQQTTLDVNTINKTRGNGLV